MKKTLVFVENHRPVTDSLTVAEVFGKRHDNVIRDIRTILKELDDEWGLLNFEETSFTHPQNGQIYQKYLLTEDGFTILVMGYSGKEAMRFKVKYIQAFRELQNQLLQKQMLLELPKNYKEALLALVTEVEKNEQLEADKLALEQCLAEAEPKLTYVDQILASKDTVCITQIAKDYGLSGKRLNAILHEDGVQFKVNGQWVLYSKYQHMGYTHSHTVQYTRSNGDRGVQLQTEWTQKGRLFVHDLLTKRGIVACMDRGQTTTNVIPLTS
ncbi:phage antirepressor KilAC domain-containing protein [Alicyclobacillus tolerans]|uniref:Phage regulatory protein, rha family n=1 Tax=Alicyclobacillus tolerans TaxID=90970 RepID=A0A1M6WS06_9BACL|nr:phage antirepressor KilAC domain-containing protein [Alicyclobacillus montanus]SHK96456.1 phage regulatory protein, rha family [Alicyclobacillus montanus]